MRKQRHETYTCCPFEAALDVMGSKWKATILFRLLDGTWRFNELRRSMPNVTQRMLTIQLRELEADGMIRREAFPEVPPRVEYSLSELGRTLEPLLRELYRWGAEHLQSGQLTPAPVHAEGDGEATIPRADARESVD
jgi:DNA-binding HxlR family transcriptional regulator